ncbi:MAG: serine/threonine-protein kinase [Candidatus Eisenbacteria bacterium]
MIGRTISHYKILEMLGEGGMGEVYRALQEKPIRREVALKIVKLGMDTKEVLARFESERQALAMMDHPNIARVFDAGSTDQGRPYFVMEYVPGTTITDYCDRHRLSMRERLKLFIPVCLGVHHAHQKGIIHRDIKPSNVIVTIKDGAPVPKIIDFGLAKALHLSLTEATLVTEHGRLIGTPAYMSPEQAEMTGLGVDTTTDVYSLGVLLYELLAGSLPYDPRRIREVGWEGLRFLIRDTDPPKASTRIHSLDEETISTIAERRRTEPRLLAAQIRGELDWITLRAMEKDRTRRYQSASELAADVGRFLRNEPVVARQPSTVYTIRKLLARHKAASVVAGAALLLVIGFGIWMSVLYHRAERNLARALEAESAAATEAEAAKQVSNFLVDLFAISDPRVARGREITAREILDKGAGKAERELSGQPLVLARLVETIGIVYMNLGLYDESESLHQKTLGIREERLGPDHPDVAASLNHLANTLHMRGEYDGALVLHERALAVRESALAPDDPDLAVSLHNLADLLEDRGDYERARALFERALEIKEKSLGPDHPATAAALHDLALLLSETGDLERARALLERALAIQERAYGSVHSDIAQTLENLGGLHGTLGEYETARALKERALAIREEVYGPEHPLVANSLSNMATLQWETGDYESARRLYERALAIEEEALGPNHPDLASTANNLGILLWSIGDHEGARRLFERALLIWESALGPDHPNVATALGNIGGLLNETGEHEAACAYHERALAITEKALGPDHPDVAHPLNNLAEAYRLSGNFEEARPRYERALAIWETALGPEHPVLAYSLTGLADLYRDTGDFETAERLYERALAIREAKQGADHPELAPILEGYAELLRTTGRRSEAGALETRAEKIRGKS